VVVKWLALLFLVFGARPQTKAPPAKGPAKGPGRGLRTSLTKPELVALAKSEGFPDPNLAAAVALAESGGNPEAVNATSREYSVGLWQINRKAHPQYSEETLRNPTENARAAYAISNGGMSWKPWGAYTDGSYKKYL
jgi:hypothetical protein